MFTHILIYANILLYIYIYMPISADVYTDFWYLGHINSCKKVYVHVILCSTILWNHTGIILYTKMFSHLLHMYVISLHLIIYFLMIYFCSCILHVRVCTFVFLVYMHIYFLLYLHQVFFNTIVAFLYAYMCTYIYIYCTYIFSWIYIYIICMCIYLKNVLHLCL